MISTRVTIKDDVRQWNALTKQAKLLSKPGGNSVDIGIFREQGSDLVNYAAYNEFGSHKKNIPERSWMRSTFDEWHDRMFKKIQDNIIPILLGRFSKKKLLNQIGSFMTNAMKRKISSSKSWAVPNVDSTIAKKGSNTPLVDSTRMKRSVTHRISDDSSKEAVRSLGL